MRLFEIVQKYDMSGRQYAWVYHPVAGFHLRKGGYASHSILLDKTEDEFPRIAYDSYDRGYIYPNLQHKILYIMPTDAREYFTYPIKQIFKRKFPGWSFVFMNEHQHYDTFKGKLLPKIKEGIRDTIYFIREDFVDKCYTYATNRKYFLRQLKNNINDSLKEGYVSGTVTINGDIIIVSSYTEKYVIRSPKIKKGKVPIFKDFKIIPMKVTIK